MTGVLFMQSQTFAGADTMMHAQIMRYLDRDAFQVHVALNRDDDPAAPSSAAAAISAVPGVRTVRIDFGPSLHDAEGLTRLLLARRAPGLALGLARLIAYARANDIRIVHCTEKPRDALYGLAVARAAGALCVIHLHVKWERWINRGVRWALRHADGVIGVSRFVADAAIAAGGCPPERVFAVVNGLDLARWDGPADGTAIRREFGVPDGVPLIGVVSRLFVWKGHLDLVRALAPLKRRGLDFRLLIVGEDDPRGAPGRPPLSAEIRQLVASLDLSDRVIFAGWRRDVRDIMAALDLYAMPTFEEPCAVVFLEAMAARLPIVALASGGTPEEVEHGVSGLLSPPGDIAALSENIATLLRDPDLRARMGAAGRTAVEGRLSAPAMAQRVEEVYRTLLDRRGLRVTKRSDVAIAR